VSTNARINRAIIDADVIIAIDRRGVAHVVKHRTASTADVKAEVRLTVTHTAIEEYSTEEPSDTGLIDLTPRAGAWLPVGDVLETLKAAAEARAHVLISGTKVSGAQYHNRHVEALDVTDQHFVCLDPQSGESRSFRLDGIKSVTPA
jgi:hypothetical protein